MSLNDYRQFYDLIIRAKGSIVESVRVIGFVFNGKPNAENFHLELHLDTGQTRLLRPGRDGESLRISQEPWRDPFEEPITEINAAFVKQYGKWSVLELSSFTPVASLVGQKLTAIAPVFNQTAKLIGLHLITQRGCVSYLVEWDEGHILSGCDDEMLTEKGYQSTVTSMTSSYRPCENRTTSQTALSVPTHSPRRRCHLATTLSHHRRQGHLDTSAHPAATSPFVFKSNHPLIRCRAAIR